ncbi:MAG: hypothetical protein LBS22_01815 [Puniceicoccales bacterium]|nr:hypothetical protein [Puniceicoccales bacterium]
MDDTNFLEGIAELKEQAAAQRRLGYRYMRVKTEGNGSNIGNHAENIDIDALLALNPDTMEFGKAYPIGDRNYTWYMHQDIPRLAVRKVDGTPPTYEFGTLRGSQFEETATTAIWVYSTEIKKLNP